jgi:hypothetical protein
MFEAKRDRGERESWWIVGKSLFVVYGMPIGIAVGVVVGAGLEIRDFQHSAAKGLLVGVATGAACAGALARHGARGKYKWVQSELTSPDTDWEAIVTALNTIAADQHYLMLRKEPGYVAYTPTLVRPVAAGPLTVSGEYLSVVVTLLNTTTIAITGPQHMVDKFETAIEDGR